MNALRTLRGRAGMTLLEMMAALLLSGLVIGTAMSFFQQQGQALSLGTSQLTVLQNYRYAMATLRRDLRTAGAGVPNGQPWLVYAGPDLVAFNADYVTSEPSDPFAIYIDTAATPFATEALTKARRITFPGTSVVYPDTTYREQGVNSPAETLLFFFAADTSTARGDDFVLYRQVNAEPPAVVARNLLRMEDRPFFEYLRLLESDTAAATLAPVPANRMPLRHAEKLHGAPADTGNAALIDRVRAVRISVTATNGKAGPKEVTRNATRVVRLPNAGMAVARTCGEAPQLGTALSVAPFFQPGGQPAVSLAWGPAADERGGEADVLRYVIWRKTSPGADWGDPFLSIPAGQAGYVYTDTDVQRGRAYWYALAAQDCSPALSPLAPAAGVTIP